MNRKYEKVLLKFIFSSSTLALVTGCSSSASSDDNKDSEETTEKETTKKNYYGLGDTFTFDDLEITMGTEITFVTLDNQYSDLNGSTIAKIPVTVKNLKDETYILNLFYINIFGSQGRELESVSSYFLDDSVDFAGDLKVKKLIKNFRKLKS